MRGFAVVFGREIRQRRRLLAIGLLLGLVPLIPGARLANDSHAVMDPNAAIGLALAASGALAVLLGATGIAGDQLAGRMGFYFNRPLAGGSIWAGKAAAMLFLVASSTILVLLPTLLLAPREMATVLGALGYAGSLSLGTLALAWLGALIAVLALAHATAVALGSRSPWIVLDLAALVLLGAVGAALWRWMGAQGVPLLGWILLVFGGAALVAVGVAGALQLLVGRIDLRRGHRTQSLVLWGALGVALLGLFAYSRWVVDVGVEDLARVHALAPAPRGAWLAVSGPVRHRPGFATSFLLDLEQGRSLRLRAAPDPALHLPRISFSGDGGTAAWFEPLGPSSRAGVELTTLDLTDPRSRPRSTGLTFAPAMGWETFFTALSPDGRRFAALDDHRLTVEDLGAHRLLAALEIAAEPSLAKNLSFAGPDRLRLDRLNYYAWGGPLTAEDGRTTVTLDTVDLRRGRLVPGATIESELRKGSRWVRAPEGDRALFLGHDALEVRDGESGALLGTLAGRHITACFVPGGLLTTEWERREGSRGRIVRLFDRDGRQERGRLALPGAFRVAIVAEGPGSPPQIVAQEAQPWGGTHPWQRWAVDLVKAAFEPLPPVRLVELGGDAPWSPTGLRQGDGVVVPDSLTGGVRVLLHPMRRPDFDREPPRDLQITKK